MQDRPRQRSRGIEASAVEAGLQSRTAELSSGPAWHWCQGWGIVCISGELKGGEPVLGDGDCKQQLLLEIAHTASFCDFQFSCLSSPSGCELLSVKDGLMHPRISTPSLVQKCLLNGTTDRWMKSQHAATFWSQMKDQGKGTPTDLFIIRPHCSPPPPCPPNPALPYLLSGKYQCKDTPSPDKTSLL